MSSNNPMTPAPSPAPRGQRTRERLKIYPANWREIVEQIRARSGGRCECTGECGLHTGEPSFACWGAAHAACEWPASCTCLCHEGAEHTTRCTERNGELARWAKGKIILTTAHLCHDPSCTDLGHLRHMCQRCHLRYDAPMHARHAAETRRLGRAAAMDASGQRSLFQEPRP